MGNDVTEKKIVVFVFQINRATLYNYLGKKGLESRWSYEDHVRRLGNMILLVSGRQLKGDCVVNAHHGHGPETADLHLSSSLYAGI